MVIWLMLGLQVGWALSKHYWLVVCCLVHEDECYLVLWTCVGSLVCPTSEEPYNRLRADLYYRVRRNHKQVFMAQRNKQSQHWGHVLMYVQVSAFLGLHDYSQRLRVQYLKIFIISVMVGQLFTFKNFGRKTWEVIESIIYGPALRKSKTCRLFFAN